MNKIFYTAVVGLLASTAAALPASKSLSNLGERTIGPAGRISNFRDIPPSAELHWTPCYTKFHCANLVVPLDYANPSLGTTVVAWIRQDPPNSTGIDILYNPGGPGASGVTSLLSGTGDLIIKETGGRYNVVSFDPRGVNASSIGTPLTCFPGHPEVRDTYTGGSPSNDQERYAQAVAYGKWCTAANNATKARYAGTVAVVQDMMRYTELRAIQDGKKPDEALIWFYGVSYGTVIGHTLAALYPNRIGRIIIDANVNSDDFYNGLPETAVEDADDGMQYFFKTCYEAGEGKCSFAGKSGSAQDIEKRFNALLAKLEKDPFQIILPSLSVPMIVSKKYVLQVLFQALYSPMFNYPYVSQGLTALEKGNATAVVDVLAALSKTSATSPGPFNYTSIASNEALRLITAIDAAGRYPIKGVDDYVKAVDEIEATSVWFGANYAQGNPLTSAGFNLLPPKSQMFSGFKKTKTNNPILFINTNGDPITPLSSAKHMSKYFDDSVVLTQNSGGHGRWSVPSSCTTGHVKAYFDSGKLPKEGTVCETDIKPFADSKTKRDLLSPAEVFAWEGF
ncbi:TAP-like protein-domain-containing protein [Phaeosphaeriaceae sp. PMI808]|nr:TAP-like protein-domain-containing protein [Phaeosphaeriaceae sp. PMI808]